MLKQAILSLNPPAVTCAIVQDGKTVYTSAGLGVKPLLAVYREQPLLLRGSAVADTVIGKAAAVLLVLGGVSQAYGQIMSRPAMDYLAAHGISHACGQEVPFILNRTEDGSCPLEASVEQIDDLQEAFVALTNRVAELMAGR